MNWTGAANLRFPIGAWAKGIPKYWETCESLVAACPLTGPLLVCTVCPTVQLDDRCSKSVAYTRTTTATRTRRIEDFMVNIDRLLHRGEKAGGNKEE